jgi:hypothetical protein
MLMGPTGTGTPHCRARVHHAVSHDMTALLKCRIYAFLMGRESIEKQQITVSHCQSGQGHRACGDSDSGH